MEKYYITPNNWQRIYLSLQRISRIRVKEEATTYQFIEGVYFIMKTGAQWGFVASVEGGYGFERKWISPDILRH